MKQYEAYLNALNRIGKAHHYMNEQDIKHSQFDYIFTYGMVMLGAGIVIGIGLGVAIGALAL
jgi:CHASE3 domain sensor protein